MKAESAVLENRDKRAKYVALAEEAAKEIGRLSYYSPLEGPRFEQLVFWIKEFGFEEVIEAIYISFDRYHRAKCWSYAFEKIGGICYNRRKKRQGREVQNVIHIVASTEDVEYLKRAYGIEIKDGMRLEDIYLGIEIDQATKIT